MVISKQRSVAFCNKIMDTRLPQPAGCGDKYDVSSLCSRLLRRCIPRNDAVTNGEGWHRPWCDKILGTGPSMTGGRGAGFVRLLRSARNDAERNNIAFKGLDVVRQYAALLKRRVQTGTRARKALVVTRQANPLGRSMIEMLGVLAIIGVLSVAGIAGYSKAMEKWKINKMAEEYSYLIHGLLGHLTEFQNLPINTGLVDTSFGLNLVPDSYKKINFRRMYDPYGNIIQLFSRNNRLVIDMYLGGALDEDGNIAHNTNFSGKLCQSLMTDLVQPLHSAVHHIFFTYKSGAAYYGDSTCKDNPNAKCLSSITLSDINDICNYCIDEEKICAIVLEF